MSRDIDAAIGTALGGRQIQPILLFKMDFDVADGGSLGVWSGIGNFTWGGLTYTGVGSFAEISAITETSDMRAVGAKFSLSGVPSANLAVALATNYQERPASLYLALVDDALNLIGTPYKMFGGRMDVMSIEESGVDATVSIEVENRLIDLERPKLSNYTNEDQLRRYPGDVGLEFVGPLNDGAELKWGAGTDIG